MKVFSLVFLLVFVLFACDDEADLSANEREIEPPILKQNVVQINDVLGGYYSALPSHYDHNQKAYPVIICLHGAGQYGNGSSELHHLTDEAIPALLAQNRFPPNFTVQGKNYSFIVLAPQFSVRPTPVQVLSFIDYAKRKYRVDTSRIFMVGFSEGGTLACDVAASYPKRLAALISIAGVSKSGDIASKCQSIADNDLPVWILHNDQDELMDVNLSRNFVSTINLYSPAIVPRYTEFVPYGLWNHDAWTRATDPAFKEDGLSIYEWMLHYKR